MSWASARQSTRTEDVAYCLLGLFDIKMPLLYGEGRAAFQRLQQEILRRELGDSLLAWTRPPDLQDESALDVLATSPSHFAGAANVLEGSRGSRVLITAQGQGFRLHVPPFPQSTVYCHRQLDEMLVVLGCFRYKPIRHGQKPVRCVLHLWSYNSCGHCSTSLGISRSPRVYDEDGMAYAKCYRAVQAEGSVYIHADAREARDCRPEFASHAHRQLRLASFSLVEPADPQKAAEDAARFKIR